MKTADRSGPPARARIFGTVSEGIFAGQDREGRWRERTDVSARSSATVGVEFDRKWPACGMAIGGLAFELSDSGHGRGRRAAPAAGGFMFPTPSACEPDSWRYIEIVDKDGAPPSHPNQRFYNKATGQIVQKTLEHVALAWPTPTVQDAKNCGGPAQHARRTPPLNARADGPLNPVWVEWLMGFPAEWTSRSAPGVAAPSHSSAPDREAAVVTALKAAPEAAHGSRARRRFRHPDAERGGAEKLRSPRHPEVAS